MKRYVSCLLLGWAICTSAQVRIQVNLDEEAQTIHSFGASDCWRTQFIGRNWPVEKREAMADYLFSTDLDEKGNPKGIGLTLWRFNIGSGSHEIADRSGVASDWRRTECFLDSLGKWDWTKQAGQRWFLEAARKRGVPYTLGFSISAPYFMSKNGMTRASEDNQYANLKEDQYDDYARFMAVVSRKLGFDYISPINEPQWNWIRSGQEGMQATNAECSRLIHYLDKEIRNQKAATQIAFGEAGCINYLYESLSKGDDRDNQIEEIFSASGKHSIAGLKTLLPVVTGHSYWSTWPLDSLYGWRERLNTKIKNTLPRYGYWQTEYCPMEKNEENPNGGGKRDVGIDAALYIGRVIHADLTVADASSWQYWTAFTEWDYKDGLIYIDDGVQTSGANSSNDGLVQTCKQDGEFRTSKIMWMLGNYSFFIRPGMKRILTSMNGTQKQNPGSSLMVSAYKDNSVEKLVLVYINTGKKDIEVNMVMNDANSGQYRFFGTYETSEKKNLTYTGIVDRNVVIPARSIITLTSIAQ